MSEADRARLHDIPDEQARRYSLVLSVASGHWIAQVPADAGPLRPTRRSSESAPLATRSCAARPDNASPPRRLGRRTSRDQRASGPSYIAASAMAVDEMIAIDDIDPRDVYDDYKHYEGY